MDKSDVKVHESQSDTSSVITMKEYAPSEYPSSEPPPAYMKPRSNALRIAKLAAFTVIVSSIILGGFILAASWIQANTARNLDLTLNQELLDDLQPNYEHLIANEALSEQQNNSIDQVPAKNEASEENESSSDGDKMLLEKKASQSNEEGLIPPPPPPPVQPLSSKTEDKRVLDLDELANILMQKNIRGNVNCIVEKRRNEELVDHAPVPLNLPSMPFGMNLTTPPRLQHLTGEQMIVVCKGDEDEERNSAGDDDEKIEDVQPLAFPLPGHILNQILQAHSQIIPLHAILQHPLVRQLPIRPISFQQIPVQEISLRQIPLQEIPLRPMLPMPQISIRQPPVQQLPVQPVPLQRIPLRPFPMPQIPIRQLPVQQVPIHPTPLQRIPLRQLSMPQVPIQQLPIQQLPLQQVPIQQLPIQQIPIQQIPIQQIPIQRIPFQPVPNQNVPVEVNQLPGQNFPQIPFQRMTFPPHRQQPEPLVFHHQMMAEQRPPPPPPPQQQQTQQIFPPRNVFVPQPQFFNNNNNNNEQQPNVPIPPEMIPLKEIGFNRDRIPFNHVLHHRVPFNPMAANDVPVPRMQITHLPIRGESQIREEQVPVHHLVPPQQFQAENFRQEEPRFNERPVPMFPPHNNNNNNNQPRPLPVEVNDPGVLRVPGPMSQKPRERFPPQENDNRFFENSFLENREPQFFEETRAFRPLTVDVRPRGQGKEVVADSLMADLPKMFPANFEMKPPMVENGRKIRFPDMAESEEGRENRMPIITEITKIIPIRLEKDDGETSEENENSQQKSVEVPEMRLEKMPPRPFPIPIDAILDMIFKGIRPLMGNRGPQFPIPVDIKIERISNRPLDFPPFLKNFEIFKKDAQNSLDEESRNVRVDEKNDENDENDENDKDGAERKVEVFDGENENGQSIPLPSDAQDQQVFKMDEREEKEPETNEEDRAFLPNGQGRGARVFPIPQMMKESEIFSVFDAKTDKNGDAEIPVESSMTVANAENERQPEVGENRQGRFMGFPNPILNFFSIPDERAEVKPEIQTILKPRPRSFLPPMEPRSLKLFPVPEPEVKPEELKPPMVAAEANTEEARPHFVQPRSV